MLDEFSLVNPRLSHSVVIPDAVNSIPVHHGNRESMRAAGSNEQFGSFLKPRVYCWPSRSQVPLRIELFIDRSKQSREVFFEFSNFLILRRITLIVSDAKRSVQMLAAAMAVVVCSLPVFSKAASQGTIQGGRLPPD